MSFEGNFSWTVAMASGKEFVFERTNYVTQRRTPTLGFQHLNNRTTLKVDLNHTTPSPAQENSSLTGEYAANILQPLYAQVIIVMMYVLIIVVAVGGNLLFSYVIVMGPKMRSVTNLFLLNLAVSDILKAVICNPFTFMANLILLYWPYGALMCPIVSYVQTVAVFLSASTLVAMSVDRYVAILRPMRPKMSKRAFVATMATIWVFSSVVPMPTAITSQLTFANGSNGLCVEQFDTEYHRYIYSVVIMMLQYFIPLSVITITNCHIGYIVWIKKTPGEAVMERDKRMAESKRRLVKMIIIVVVIYAVCWLPLHVITLVGDHNPGIYDMNHMNVVWLCAHWLAMSHSCYNPVVYFTLNASFRRSLKRLLLLLRHKQRRFRDQMSLRATGIWDLGGREMYGSEESVKSRQSVKRGVDNANVKREESFAHWSNKKTKGDMYL